MSCIISRLRPTSIKTLVLIFALTFLKRLVDFKLSIISGSKRYFHLNSSSSLSTEIVNFPYPPSFKSPVIFCCPPFPIADIVITEDIPIIIPSIVKNDLTLLPLKFCIAPFKLSKKFIHFSHPR